MTQHAWKGYKKVMGMDELLSKDGVGKVRFGSTPVALTAIDALDTLLLMGFQEDYAMARDYILNMRQWNDLDATIPIQIVSGHILGGLLGAYSLSGDGQLLEKASSLGDIILEHVEEDIPSPMVHFNASSRGSQYRPRRLMLNTVGGHGLDLIHLGDLKMNGKYRKLAITLNEVIRGKTFTMPGLFAEEIDLSEEAKQPWGIPFSLGHRSGTTYEYMLKEGLYTNRRDRRATHNALKLAQAIRGTLYDHLAGKHSIARWAHYTVQDETDQSACFVLGLIVQIYQTEASDEQKILRLRTKKLAETCLSLFLDTAATAVGKDDILEVERLQPKLVESLFVLWRLTKDGDFRRMGLRMAETMEKEWRMPHGYRVPGSDSQPSWLLAHTFKYLYLLFASDTILSLDDYVFNTAGHAYPISKEKPIELQTTTFAMDLGEGMPLRRKVRVLQVKLQNPKKDWTAQ